MGVVTAPGTTNDVSTGEEQTCQFPDSGREMRAAAMSTVVVHICTVPHTNKDFDTHDHKYYYNFILLPVSCNTWHG
jgi:hypothetical protein